MTSATAVDLYKSGEYYVFGVEARGSDFMVAINSIKAQVPREQRSYDENKKLWTVHEDYEDVLGRIFPNFGSGADAIKSQGTLF